MQMLLVYFKKGTSSIEYIDFTQHQPCHYNWPYILCSHDHTTCWFLNMGLWAQPQKSVQSCACPTINELKLSNREQIYLPLLLLDVARDFIMMITNLMGYFILNIWPIFEFTSYKPYLYASPFDAFYFHVHVVRSGSYQICFSF